ncbi:MAG: alcohol dehydrogenase catalytic domain-containing protein [Candidatus Latescibacterota bacterium]
MKAVRLIAPGRPLEMQDISVPEIGPNDALVRVMAAGICHSDAHYRSGVSRVHPLPVTPGHEIAGIVEQAGPEVGSLREGDRICVHYMVTCGNCYYCYQGNEQFCTSGKMIGKHRDGGYAEYIAIPARNAFPLPPEISFEHGAIMMCSSATSLHALRKAGLRTGETVAVFGVGGLGLSAVQLAYAFGALRVFAVDINSNRLSLAARFGAVPVNAAETDPVSAIMAMTGGNGVDVALELIGLPLTMRQAVTALAIGGRAALAGISDKGMEIVPYHELINKEAAIIGVSDHLASEIPLLISLVQRGKLQLSEVITRTVPLDDGAINGVLDEMEKYGGGVRAVIQP